MEKEMRKFLFGFLRKGKVDIEKQISRVKEIEKTSEVTKRKSEGRYGGWTVFDNGAFDSPKNFDGYFGRSRDSFKDLLSFEDCCKDFHKLDEENKKSLVLDVMGQGRIGVELKASMSIGWTYNDKQIENIPSRVLEKGNIFDLKVLKKHFSKLERLLSSGNFNLNAVFFRAVGGLGIYYGNLYALSFLYEKIFSRIYSLMNVGGKMYLSMAYGDASEDTNYAQKLMVVLKGMGYEIETDGNGNYILTRTNNKKTLPSLKEINKVQPLITIKTLESLKD